MSRSAMPALGRLRRVPLFSACLGMALIASADAHATTANAANEHPVGSRFGSFDRMRASAPTRDPLSQTNGAARPATPSGTTITVTTCNDSGAGSLRNAVSVAASGDTIDLASLACSTITLTSGAIDIAQNDLLLIGPGAFQLAIDGGASQSRLDRVFDHSGAGTLAIDYLTITDATYATYAAGGVARGGCIRSAGHVSMLLSIVSSCRIAQGGKNVATGGGLFAAEGLDLVASIVIDNVAYSPGGGGNAGGAATFGPLTAKYSTIANNTAYYIGGLFANSDNSATGSLIEKTTISGNSAFEIGGVGLTGDAAATIRDSTVSANRGDFVVGGILSSAPLHLHNSTVVFNEAASAVADTGILDVGLVLTGPFADLQSSIVANNHVDLSETPRDISVQGTGFVAGNNNLVTFTDVAMPADTIYADPLLYPLAFNGGVTQTHALTDASPAIDAGNNSAALTYDQRVLPRVVGADADIGAFERQGPADSEYIFIDGFD